MAGNHVARRAAFLGLTGVLLFVGSAIFGGLKLAGYSHVSQLISETYATGTDWGGRLRLFAIIPSGVFIALFAFTAKEHFQRSKAATFGWRSLGIFYGLGTVLVGIFPCDRGCSPLDGETSTSQLIHDVTGGLTYLFVPVAVVALGYAAKTLPNGKPLALAGFVLGSISILFVLVFFIDPAAEFAGLYQRVIEGSILSWIVATSIFLLSEGRKNSNREIS